MGGVKVMRLIQNPDVMDEISANITSYFDDSLRNYSIEELFEWTNHYLNWSDSISGNRPSDPREVLKSGEGQCQEYSLLFASACVATNKDVRIVVCEKSNFLNGHHAWNQVILDGSWVDVDSSLSKVNSLETYHGWFWWADVGEDCFVFSFDLDGKCEDITGEFVCTY